MIAFRDFFRSYLSSKDWLVDLNFLLDFWVTVELWSLYRQFVFSWLLIAYEHCFLTLGGRKWIHFLTFHLFNQSHCMLLSLLSFTEFFLTHIMLTFRFIFTAGRFILDTILQFHLLFLLFRFNFDLFFQLEYL